MIKCSYIDKLRTSAFELALSAFKEDMPSGDITVEVLELSEKQGQGKIICREEVCMSGGLWFDQILRAYREFSPEINLEIKSSAQDGDILSAGSTLFEFEGRVADIVSLERTFLNFLGRATGIATLTHRFVSKARKCGCKTKILDTRKTLPGFRFLDKYSVLCGGGANHRMGLSDMVLIKENHIAPLNGVTQALSFIRERLKKDIPIQIEVQNMGQLKEAIDSSCPLIMLDNFTPEMVSQACQLERNDSQLEVSGGITLDNMDSYCHPQLDRISIGALTHSVKAPDLSLLINEG